VLAAAKARGPYGVLVIPYAPDAFVDVAYAVFRSPADRGCWHLVTGPGRRGEAPLQAARRHALQQAGVPGDAAYVALDSRATIPVESCAGACGLPEYAFAVRVEPAELRVPTEQEHCWVSYEVAEGLVRRESERDALWELRRRFGCRRR
jgi:dATP pyrophosphohydrolase